jgi:hypothetical protein
MPAPIGPIGPPPTPVGPQIPVGEPNILSQRTAPAAAPRFEALGTHLAEPGVMPASRSGEPPAQEAPMSLPPLPPERGGGGAVESLPPLPSELPGDSLPPLPAQYR